MKSRSLAPCIQQWGKEGLVQQQRRATTDFAPKLLGVRTPPEARPDFKQKGGDLTEADGKIEPAAHEVSETCAGKRFRVHVSIFSLSTLGARPRRIRVFIIRQDLARDRVRKI